MMRKKDWAVLLATIVYSFLFYEQNAGLNFFIFSIILTGLFAFIDNTLLKNKAWLIIAGLTILSGLFILLYGSWLAILGNCICLMLLSAASIRSQSGVIVNLFTASFSVLGSVVWMIVNIFKSSNTKTENEATKPKGRFLVYAIPLFIALIFFFIYKNANPLFEKYTKEINLDFVSWAWVFFTLGGLFLVYGLIRHERFKDLDAWEDKQGEIILSEHAKDTKLDEKKAAMILFVLLNVMLFFINMLDVNYLYLGAGMPKGITHKEFVHNGVGMLILSIVMGIAVILYFFRGALNFSSQNKVVKIMVYAWLFQNLIMVISTALRNKMYIDDALLTYKRIGVYYWLFLAVLGLVTTIVKVQKAKTKWYLLKHNSYMAFVILVLSGGLDWDKFISDYNISNSKLMASLDKKYMISLSETNLAQLYAIKDDKDFNTDSIYHYGYYNRYGTNYGGLDSKLYDFLFQIQNEDWRSFTFRKKRVSNEMNDLIVSGKINSLDLSKTHIKTLKPVIACKNVSELKLNYCAHEVYADLYQFEKLEKLSVSGINEVDILRIKKCKNLKTITVVSSSEEMIKKLEFVMPGVKVEVGDYNW